MKPRKKLRIRVTTPSRVEHGLVPRCANSDFYFFWLFGSGESCRDEVGQLHPGISRVKYSRSTAQAMKDFAEKPFAGINPAAFGEILRTNFFGELRDLARFLDAGVILPKPGHRVRVAGEAFFQR